MTNPIFQDDEKNSAAGAAATAVLRVGSAGGMFRGMDHFAIQGAVDYVARMGGGRVEIEAGEYHLRNAIILPDGVSLLGLGDGVVLRKEASVSSVLTKDLDWHHRRVTLAEAQHFHVGDGFFLMSERLDGGTAQQASRHTVIDRQDDVLVLDCVPEFNHWIQHRARAVSTHSLIECRGAKNVSIRHLTLDGNRADNELLDGNFGAAIYLYKCAGIEIRNLRIRDFHGDGISWQASHDVRVEDCEVIGVTSLGLHPGSGSHRPVMRGNTTKDCETGIYWCWGVEDGLAEGNIISDCSKHGISIGHRDIHNAIKNNQISNCGEAGIFFRPERSPAHTAHRNLVEGNKISCPPDKPKSRGIQLCRGVEDVILRKNHISIQSSQRGKALVIPASARRIVSESNHINEMSPKK